MPDEQATGARRGWRETIEPGLYRAHRVACPSSQDRRRARRCGCPFQIQVPGARPATTRFVTVPGTVSEARAERRRLLAAGRPEPEAAATAGTETLDDFAAHYLRAKSAVLAPATIYTTEESYRLRVSPASAGCLSTRSAGSASRSGWPSSPHRRRVGG